MLGRPIFTGEYQYVLCVCLRERECVQDFNKLKKDAPPPLK